MDLNKSVWTTKDKEDFLKELEQMSNPEKIAFTKKIVNTNMNVLGIPIPKLRHLAKEISKGNFYSFLDLNINDYYENTIINIVLISIINDLTLLKHYLDIYVKEIDNWSSTDSFTINIKKNKKGYFNLALKYLNSPLTFSKRLGLIIILKFAGDSDYIDKIFAILDQFKDEKEYYVNMALAWVLSECMIKNRDKTLEYLKHHNLNAFVINKGISKCRDSYRVSASDKEFLLIYRV